MSDRWHFLAVVFYGECAWVAGTTSWNCVGQGDTFEAAVESLEILLCAYYHGEKEDGGEPFAVTRDGELPIEEMRLRDGDRALVPGETPDRAQRYVVRVTLDPSKWEPFLPEDSELGQPVSKPSGGGEHAG